MSTDTFHTHTEPTSAVSSRGIKDVSSAKNDEPPAELSTCSAGFPADYIMDVKLDAHMGSDIPLYDRRFRKDNRSNDEIPTFKREQGDPFNFEKEDYWLFCVHLHDAEMEFAIGGKNPVFATSHPNWRNVSKKTDREIIFFDKGLCSSRAELQLSWNRYVAIRCPKMTNPAITIKAKGNFGTVKWVGLFVKSTADDNNQFIAVKTTNKLLPKYAERNVNYEWYTPDGGVDVTNDRSITLWPKQLYGTKGNSAKTYDTYVTIDPANHHRVGETHLERVKDKVNKGSGLDVTSKGKTYTWNESGPTIIQGIYVCSHYRTRTGWKYFNYSAGTKIQAKDKHGLMVLLEIFGTVGKLATGILKGDFASVVGTILDIPGMFGGEVDADVKGLVTSIVQAGNTWYDKRIKELEADKKRKEELEKLKQEKEKLKINTAGVELISHKTYIFDSDFGSD